MSAQNAINDVSTLIRVPNKTLDALTDKINMCIGSIISDARLAGEKTVIINIGVGSLSVSLTDMQCKFVPSKNLKATIKKCLESDFDPIECMLEKELADKLTAACIEVL